MAKQKVPVTILTGYLGSGKSTLLQHILYEQQEYKIAIIQNEFGGGQGADATVFVEENGSSNVDYLEVANGCVCCSVKDTFVQTIEDLLKRNQYFDQIIIETDGLADPGSVASVFWLDEALESEIYLDAIVTLIDCKFLFKQLRISEQNEVNACKRQIACADVVVLNKVDLIGREESEIEKLKAEVRKYSPFAPILTSERSRVDLQCILRVNAFDKRKVIESLPVHTSKDHNDDVKAIELTYAGVGVDLDALEAWIGELVWEDYLDQIYRIKGVLASREDDFKYVLHGVQNIFEIRKTELTFGEKASKLVFIGYQLDAEKIRLGWERLFELGK